MVECRCGTRFLFKAVQPERMPDQPARMILTATSRPSRESRARYTSPIPPAPREERISYGSSFVPGVSVIRERHYSQTTVLVRA
jgi:hypothetical protein